MGTHKHTGFAAIILPILFLTACGGGSNSAPAEPPPGDDGTGGITRGGVAVGPISTFGSVVVNGVTFDTNNAMFTINDTAGTQSDLRVGHVVTVKGEIDDNGTTGTADTVDFDDVVKGPIESIDVVTGQVGVLGQKVLVRPEVSFDDNISPASIEGLSIGLIIEVSGQIDANDDIVATRIEAKPAGTQFEVHGTVSALDSANLQFNINNLVVDYSNASLDNFAGGQISDGDFVEAKGTSLGAADELQATSVELETLLPGVAAGDRVELEGFITRFSSPQDFDVTGQPVSTSASTTFTGGVAADLGQNIKVEVEGELDGNGVLVADNVDIRPSKAVRTQALVDSVDAANNSMVMLSITVTVDELTRFEDKSNADVDPLGISDINAGDYVEIRGDEFPAGSGDIRATLFERDDPDADSTLQGFVETISDPSFTILGVTVETNGATIFRDENDNAITAGAFFTQVGVNSLVKAKGTEVSDATITATEVEFELEF